MSLNPVLIRWSISLRTINWMSPASPTPSPEVQLRNSPTRTPPPCSSLRPSLWLRCWNTSSFCRSEQSSWETDQRTWTPAYFSNHPAKSREFRRADHLWHRVDRRWGPVVKGSSSLAIHAFWILEVQNDVLQNSSSRCGVKLGQTLWLDTLRRGR